MRLIVTGGAGMGKSYTVRSFVREVKGLVLAAFGDAAAEASCLLGAPTGCASFQLKGGASTLHRLFGVPVGYCGRLRPQMKTYTRLQQTLKPAVLAVMDEMSMIGRMFMGKILHRVENVLGAAPRQYGRVVSLGGLDAVVTGHPAQIKSVGDEYWWKEGPCKGRAKNLPPRQSEAQAPASVS